MREIERDPHLAQVLQVVDDGLAVGHLLREQGRQGRDARRAQRLGTDDVVELGRVDVQEAAERFVEKPLHHGRELDIERGELDPDLVSDRHADLVGQPASGEDPLGRQAVGKAVNQRVLPVAAERGGERLALPLDRRVDLGHDFDVIDPVDCVDPSDCCVGDRLDQDDAGVLERHLVELAVQHADHGVQHPPGDHDQGERQHDAEHGREAPSFVPADPAQHHQPAHGQAPQGWDHPFHEACSTRSAGTSPRMASAGLIRNARRAGAHARARRPPARTGSPRSG